MGERYICSESSRYDNEFNSTNQQEQNKMADKQCASMMTVSDQEDTEENAGASFNMKGASFNMKITEDANNDDDNDDDAAPAPAPADDDHDDNGEPETDVKSGVSTGHAATEAASVKKFQEELIHITRDMALLDVLDTFARTHLRFAFLHWKQSHHKKRAQQAEQMTKNEEAAAFAEAKRLVDRDWALLEALDIHVEKVRKMLRSSFRNWHELKTVWRMLNLSKSPKWLREEEDEDEEEEEEEKAPL